MNVVDRILNLFWSRDILSFTHILSIAKSSVFENGIYSLIIFDSSWNFKNDKDLSFVSFVHYLEIVPPDFLKMRESMHYFMKMRLYSMGFLNYSDSEIFLLSLIIIRLSSLHFFFK